MDTAPKRIFELTVDEFLKVLDQHQTNRFSDVPPATVILTKKVQLKALARRYGWGESTLYKWCKNRIIPHSRVFSEYWFDLDEIELWISQNKILTKDETLKKFEDRKRNSNVRKNDK